MELIQLLVTLPDDYKIIITDSLGFELETGSVYQIIDSDYLNYTISDLTIQLEMNMVIAEIDY